MRLPFVCFLIVFFSGCNVLNNETEMILADVASDVAQLANESEHHELIYSSRVNAEKASENAKQSFDVGGIVGVAKGTLEGFGTGGPIGAGIALLTGGMAYMQRKKFKGVADMMEVEPDPEKCKLIRKGVA